MEVCAGKVPLDLGCSWLSHIKNILTPVFIRQELIEGRWEGIELRDAGIKLGSR